MKYVIPFVLLLITSPAFAQTDATADQLVAEFKKNAKCYKHTVYEEAKVICYAPNKVVGVWGGGSIHLSRVSSVKKEGQSTVLKFSGGSLIIEKGVVKLDCGRTETLKRLSQSDRNSLIKRKKISPPSKRLRTYVRKTEDGKTVVVAHAQNDKKFSKVYAYIGDGKHFKTLRVKSASRSKITKALEVSLENGGRIVLGGRNKKLVTEATFQKESQSQKLKLLPVKSSEVSKIRKSLQLYESSSSLPICFVDGPLPMRP